MEKIEKTIEGKYAAKDGKVAITLEWLPNGKVVLTIVVNIFFISFTKQFDLTHLFNKKAEL